MFLIVLLYALFGSSFPITKMLLQYVHPILLTGVRMIMAGIVLLMYYCWIQRHKITIAREHLIIFAQIIFFGVYITYILRFWGLNYLSASKTAFLFNISPFITALYSYLLFKEKLSLQQWLGLLLGFLGILPILITTSKSESFFGELAFISWPEIAVLAAVASHSYSWILMRKLVREKGYAPIMTNGISMLIGGIFALATSVIFETPKPIADPGAFASWLILVTIISNIICHNLYVYLLKKYTATFLAFSGFLGPIFAAFYGWLFMKESITWHFFASGFIVSIGLWLFYHHELRQMAIPEPEAFD